jgi:hypothetical protein
MNQVYKNMALGRFHTASALNTAATHLSLKPDNNPALPHIIEFLRKEADDLMLLGIQELHIIKDHANSAQG